MDSRKRRILQAITDDYIETADPVGSRTIARKYKLGVSPATIRNEMADLEELGYLRQPHTSAGRIPSDKGYRFYVDALMHPDELAAVERQRIRREVLLRRQAIEEMIHHTAGMLSLLTHYIAVVVAPQLAKSVFRHIQLVPLDPFHVLAVLVTDPGFVENRIIEIGEPVHFSELQSLSQYLNERLRGVMLEDITRALLGELRDEIRQVRLLDEALDLLNQSLDHYGHDRVYLEGTINIFEQPEFKDVNRAKGLLEILQKKAALLSVLDGGVTHPGFRVTIGHEIPREELAECSMVTASYHIQGQVIGTVGVLGPTRMDYARVIPIVEAMADSLSEVLSTLAKRF